MRMTALACAGLLVAALGACTSSGGEDDDVARDSGGPGTAAKPTQVPAADGLVQTALPAMVIGNESPVLCVGGVMESYPPQCSGPTLIGWDWAAQPDDSYEQAGTVRFGNYVVRGTWDGESFTAESAEPADFVDSAQPEAPPAPAVDLPPEELAAIADALADDLPGTQSSYSDETRAYLDVIYDDGSYQDFLDAEYGQWVVLVHSALVPAR